MKKSVSSEQLARTAAVRASPAKPMPTWARPTMARVYEWHRHGKFAEAPMPRRGCARASVRPVEPRLGGRSRPSHAAPLGDAVLIAGAAHHPRLPGSLG